MPAHERQTLIALVWVGMFTGALWGIQYGALLVLGAAVLCLVDWRWRAGQ